MFVDISSIPPTVLATVIGIVAICAGISLWSIWHAFWREFPTHQEKLIWLALAVFIPCLGGIIYALWGRKRGRRYAS